jgi:type IV fimbrial biogenesis protein FimT
MMGVPSFQSWIQNTQIRTAAESVMNGLQIARAEAVRRNVNVRFNLTDAGGKVEWSVDCETVVSIQADGYECPAGIQSRKGVEGGANARLGISLAAYPSPTTAAYFNDPGAGAGLPAGVTFDGLGRVPAKNLDGNVNNDDIALISITNTQLANARRMVVVIRTGGQVRMCDPALPLSSNPQAC